MTAPAPIAAPARLTIWDQALVNLAGWLACSRWPDPNREMMLAQARRVIPHVSHDHGLIGPLAEATLRLCNNAEAPSSMEWSRARHDMEMALAAVFMARGSQACAQLWPDENTSDPLPEEKPNAVE